MKTFLLITANGPLLILTSHDSMQEPSLLDKLTAKGIAKFIAFEVPSELAMQRYGGHYNVVYNDPRETDDLRVLDFNGERIFGLFSFGELGEPLFHETNFVNYEAA